MEKFDWKVQLHWLTCYKVLNSMQQIAFVAGQLKSEGATSEE